MNTVERLADVDESNGTTDGVAHHDGDAIWRDAELLGGDLFQHRSRALAHVRRAGQDRSAAVEVQAHDRERSGRGRRALEPERNAPAAIGRQRIGPADCVAGFAQDAFPVAIGRRVAGNERFSRFATLRRRISSRSIPSAAAAAFSCDSTAHDACGVPNPRNAVLGVVCDSSARAATRAFGVRYGPHAA